ncbi:GfV-B62-ORF1 [Ichnoviriform fumiferanae]|uniref:GfV-B62-ORF1 n=1 Tax=Ichnoviriform fumiferanae TaxID=419435 RepID=A2PZV8_9VIRU|nr:GfV-B62-ORF1 [Ichnoviriform fumiferanae]BAF45530.1 GfV-B62-ORF1 [Ichnoviriform fumiferanae]
MGNSWSDDSLTTIADSDSESSDTYPEDCEILEVKNQERVLSTPCHLELYAARTSSTDSPKSYTFDLSADEQRTRYYEIPCSSQLRVTSANDLPTTSSNSNPINGYYVDGFRMKRKFIIIEAPSNESMDDFYHMLWKNESQVVVILTTEHQNEIDPCWPTTLGEQFRGNYIVSTKKIYEKNYYTQYFFEIVSDATSSDRPRKVNLYHYTQWPIFGNSANENKLIAFILAVNAKMLENFFEASLVAPVIVHGNAEVGRAETFCAIDICFEQWFTTRRLNVLNTVKHIRSQRYGSVITANQNGLIIRILKELVKQDVLLKY